MRCTMKAGLHNHTDIATTHRLFQHTVCTCVTEGIGWVGRVCRGEGEFAHDGT